MLYAVDGALLPFLSVFLAYTHGLSPSQIGLVLAVSSATAVLAPPVVSMLADRYGRARTLLLASLIASAAALAIFAVVDGYWWVLAAYAAFSLAREPTRPLLDGIFFSAQRAVPALAEVSYHRVRLWGTFGYMVPGVLLYFFLDTTTSLGVLPILASGMAILGMVVATFLPTWPRTPADEVAQAASPGGATGSTGPTSPATVGALVGSAVRLLRRRTTAVFVLAMFLLQASMAAYFAYYPLHATTVVGLSPRWLGLVSNLGVAVELGYMAAFGWLVRRLGWRRLMVLGATAAAVRVALLAAVPTVGVVVGTQVVHGMVIIVSMVAGRILLDRQAPDEIRHTTQGLYAMIVMGGGKIAGSALGGVIAAYSLAAVFWSAAVVGLAATLLLAWSLRDVDTANPG